MKTFNYRGTEINEVNINNFENEFEDLGINVDEAWRIMGDGASDMIYISTGFLNALKTGSNQDGEWHHYFLKKESYIARKFKFNNKVSTYGL
ncbi:hypothetical protein [Myroides pelagicus]|uniref:Uncharacterized protein n=1 Tax=Myroides pelagicus TaxID=270914 RepID=A0A7K1GHF7_9FLAO|nr:hypothetical protein [Myroides pelagicus]MTH28431.1 hypothetical protein [Myroides pelagicus]